MEGIVSDNYEGEGHLAPGAAPNMVVTDTRAGGEDASVSLTRVEVTSDPVRAAHELYEARARLRAFVDAAEKLRDVFDVDGLEDHVAEACREIIALLARPPKVAR